MQMATAEISGLWPNQKLRKYVNFEAQFSAGPVSIELLLIK